VPDVQPQRTIERLRVDVEFRALAGLGGDHRDVGGNIARFGQRFPRTNLGTYLLPVSTIKYVANCVLGVLYSVALRLIELRNQNE
jgi:hypothetical protein